MSVSPADSSSLQSCHLRNLLLILRRANFHHYHVAARNRVNLKPTYHACKEARRRGLSIDVGKAARCDQRQISLVPLPVLDFSVTPASSTSPEVIDTKELTRLDRRSPPKGRPSLKCAIPGVFTRTTPNGTTSAIAVSSTSHLSSVTLSSPILPSAVLMTKLVTSSHPLSVWIAGEGARSANRSSDILTEPSVRIPVSPDWQPLDVPIDEEDMDWGLDDISDMDISPLSPSLDCGSDTASSGTQSSSGPLTPCDEVPITICIKRKSIQVCSLMDNFEKRPKFDRKEWAQPAMQRKNLIRVPARKY